MRFMTPPCVLPAAVRHVRGLPSALPQRQRLSRLFAITAARTAPAASQTQPKTGNGGGVPALRPRPVPSPQQSAAERDEQALQSGGEGQAVPQHGRHPDGNSQRPRRRADVGSRPKTVQQRYARVGGALRLAELPAGDADTYPGRGPAKRALDVGSPRRREATLARALLRLPATEADYGVVLGDEQLTGPEITRCAAVSNATALWLTQTGIAGRNRRCVSCQDPRTAQPQLSQKQCLDAG